MGQFLKISGLVCASALVLAGTPALAGGVHAGGFHMAGPTHGGFRPGAVNRPGFSTGYRPRYYGGYRPAFNGGYRPGYYAGYRPAYNAYRRGYYGGYGRYRQGYGYPYGAGFPGFGFWPNTTGVMLTLPATAPTEAYPVYQTYMAYPNYPLGYGDASYAPTGVGVIYNQPPPESPKIIYLSGDDKTHGAGLPHGLTIIRGGEVTTE
jgi:hypothetical protein